MNSSKNKLNSKISDKNNFCQTDKQTLSPKILESVMDSQHTSQGHIYRDNFSQEAAKKLHTPYFLVHACSGSKFQILKRDLKNWND